MYNLNFSQGDALDPGSGRGGTWTQTPISAWLAYVLVVTVFTKRPVVLPITKALTTTTNCTRRAKKVEGHDNKNFYVCPLPLFKFVPVPLVI